MIKTNFVTPEGTKARASKTGININDFNFSFRGKLPAMRCHTRFFSITANINRFRAIMKKDFVNKKVTFYLLIGEGAAGDRGSPMRYPGRYPCWPPSPPPPLPGDIGLTGLPAIYNKLMYVSFRINYSSSSHS